MERLGEREHNRLVPRSMPNARDGQARQLQGFECRGLHAHAKTTAAERGNAELRPDYIASVL